MRCSGPHHEDSDWRGEQRNGLYFFRGVNVETAMQVTTAQSMDVTTPQSIYYMIISANICINLFIYFSNLIIFVNLYISLFIYHDNIIVVFDAARYLEYFQISISIIF